MTVSGVTEKQQQQQQQQQPQGHQPQKQVPETALALKSLGPAGSAMAYCYAKGQLWVCTPERNVMAVDLGTGEAKDPVEVTGTPVCVALAHGEEDTLAVGMAEGKVEVNKLPDVDFEDFLARCTSTVRDVAYSASDKWAAVASDDLELLLVDLTSEDKTATPLRKHDGGVRSVCFDPKEEFLVSIGSDGVAAVWDLGSKECVFTKKVVERDASAETHQVVPRAAWKPDGSILALPGSRQPLLLERGSWKALASVPAAALAHTDDATVVGWSPDGELVASAGKDKRLLVWAAKAASAAAPLHATQVYLAEANENDEAGLLVRNLAWAGARKLALLTAAGRFAVVKVPAAAAVVPATAEQENGQETDKAAGDAAAVAAAAAEFDAESTASKKGKGQKAKEGASRFLDDEASSVDGDGDKEDKDEDGATHEEHPPEADEDEEDGMEEDDDLASKSMRMVEVPDMQGPFLPSSSPVDVAKRYLVWSTVGSIVSQNLGDHHAIEIEFADASRRPIRFTDHYHFVMGSLAEDGAIFASVALDEADAASAEEEHSVVFFRPFANYSQKNQWLYALPSGESALCVAVGARWAAVATTRRWVRLFTFSGLQDGIVALSGPVVTMVGGGDLLAIVYHGGSPFVDTTPGSGGVGADKGGIPSPSQCLHYQLLDVRRSSVVASGPLALSPHATLKWVGFSNLGILHAMDSEGVVFGLVRGFGWHWTPLVETRKHKRNKMDDFWPVGVHDDKLMGCLLKGGELYPQTNPKPLITSQSVKMPLVASNNDAGLAAMEAGRLVKRAFIHQLAYKQETLAAEGLQEEALDQELLREQGIADAHTIKMLQAAAANENGERVLELAELLHLDRSLQLAIRVADHYSLPQVAGRISDLLAARAEPMYEEMEQEPAYHQQHQQRSSFGATGRGGGGASGGRYEVEDLGAAHEEQEEDHHQQQQPQPSVAPRIRGASSSAGAGDEGKASSPAAAPVARNPFAVKKDGAGGKGGEKRPRGIAESLGSLMGSPSPKKPVLQKTASFTSEIRSKKKHDRRA